MAVAGRQITCALIWAWSICNLILTCFVLVIWQKLHSQTSKSSCSLDYYYVNLIRPDQAYGITAFNWTNKLVKWGYFPISIAVCATWTALSIASFIKWKKGNNSSDASTGKFAERAEMFFWTTLLFVMTLILTVMCWTVSYNRSTNAFLFCDIKSGCCAENCDPQSGLYLAACNPPPLNLPICPGSAGASAISLGCTAYSEALLPLSSSWNYTGSIGPGSARSFNDFSAGYSAGLGNLQWGMLGLLIFAWCLLIYLTTASDTHQLAFAANAFHIKSAASATTKKVAAASIAPMLCSPKHPIHQILSHIPSVIPAINAGQHAGVALSAFLRSHSSA